MAGILAEYPSKSSPGKTYEIREGSDGVIYCACWQWKRNKTCSHLEDYRIIRGIHNEIPPKKKKSDDKVLQNAIDNAIAEIS